MNFFVKFKWISENQQPPPPPRHLCASLADSGDNAPNHPGADAEIIAGGIQTLIKKRQFFFSAIGSNKLNKERKLFWIILYDLLGHFLIILHAE